MPNPPSYELRLAPTAAPTFKVEVARSLLARTLGLMGRSTLESGRGMYLPGTNSIHMLFMRFPIDCVFVGAPLPDGSRHVVGLRENLQPWRSVVWWARGARGAVEVPAGSARAAGIQVGQPIWLAS
ncbi:MAG: DUF192 domain-containing protein [Candidatus Limnocylindrales bacterium]